MKELEFSRYNERLRVFVTFGENASEVRKSPVTIVKGIQD